MNSTRWGRLKELFDRAYELTPGDRTVFLEDACAGDTTLNTDVESIIAASANRSGTIDT